MKNTETLSRLNHVKVIVLIRVLLQVLIITGLLAPCFSYGQGKGQDYFERGYQAYMRNQFPIAESFFRRALKQAEEKKDKAFILKFGGISQYMRGDKRSSSRTFRNALKLDPELDIFPEEVLDPSVITFFQNVKIRFLQTYQPNNQIASGKEVRKKKSKAKRRKKKKRKAKKRPSTFSFLHLLPFGTPQFHNKQFIMGAFYGGAQVVSLGLYAKRLSQISDEEAENREVEENPDLDEATRSQFLEENNKFISAVEEDAQLAIASFGLFYFTSVVHGILSAPEPKKKTIFESSMNSLEPLEFRLAERKPKTRIGFFPYKKGLALVFETEL